MIPLLELPATLIGAQNKLVGTPSVSQMKRSLILQVNMAVVYTPPLYN